MGLKKELKELKDDVSSASSSQTSQVSKSLSQLTLGRVRSPGSPSPSSPAPREQDEDRPPHHANAKRNAFQNPFKSAEMPPPEHMGWPISFPEFNEPKGVLEAYRELIKPMAPTWGRGDDADEQAPWIHMTWLGHASCLIEIPIRNTNGSAQPAGSLRAAAASKQRDSIFVLADPIFSQRAGPGKSFGVGRHQRSPCDVDDLPGCDFVIISHNHYDHLDWPSIQSIMKRFPEARYAVPLGIGDWLRSCNIAEELISELDWWEEALFDAVDLGIPADSSLEPLNRINQMLVTCVPAQHNSGRSPGDAGKTLWSGFTFEIVKPGFSDSRKGRTAAVYFAGDTGYRPSSKSDIVCPAFVQIGEKKGPFDLSMIPIWRGGTLSYISYFGLRLDHEKIPAALHASPEDALCIHKDVQSRASIGIHWGTFVGGDHEALETLVELGHAREKGGVQDLDGDKELPMGRFGCVKIGETFSVPVHKQED